MSNWKTRIEATLSQGKRPTYDELEAALLGVLVERKLVINNSNALAAALLDVLGHHKSLIDTSKAQTVAIDKMTQWLGKISDAYLQHDGGLMADIVRDFVHERVAVVNKSATGQVH